MVQLRDPQLFASLRVEGPEAAVEVYKDAGDKPTARTIRAAVEKRKVPQPNGSTAIIEEPACQHKRTLVVCQDCGQPVKQGLLTN